MNDLLNTDLYAVLGVSPDADQSEITRAYKKLARAHHPDVNPGDPDAEERFKEVGAAYDVLGDATKRAEYDEFRAMIGRGFSGNAWTDRGSGAPRPGGADPGEVDLSFLLQDLFGSQGAGARYGRSQAFRGPDVQGRVEVSLRDLLDDGRIPVTLPDGTTVEVHVPAGVDDGAVLRLPGRGLPGVNGGPCGDLIVEIGVRPDRRFTREGSDLVVDADIGFVTATCGGTVTVPTLEGRTLTMKVPAGSGQGRRLRVKHRGLPDRHGRRGDLFARLHVHVPTELDDGTRAVLEGLRDRLEPT